VIGPSLDQADIPDAIETMIRLYLKLRESDAERFVEVVERVGIEPFKAAVYPPKKEASHA
jgi:sulfite reductase (NADPH) hemoprotein beta-component